MASHFKCISRMAPFVSLFFFTACTSSPGSAVTDFTPQNSPMVLFRDADYERDFDKVIASFWRDEVVVREFEGKGGIRIRTIFAANKTSQKNIIVVPGFRESYLKYKEVIYDFHRNGFNVYAIDHRGQGFSERLPGQKEASYVANFNDYSDDLFTFIKTLVNTQSPYRTGIFAHSMGGAIATRLMETHPDVVDRAVLSSPMHGIRGMSWFPDFLLEWYLGRAIKAGKGADRPLFQKASNPADPVTPLVTSSERRRKRIVAETLAHPETMVGGPSFQWIYQAWKSSGPQQEQAASIRIPILLLQAEEEKIVDNEAQRALCARVLRCKLVVIPGARHEIWNEEDHARIPGLTLALDFLD